MRFSHTVHAGIGVACAIALVCASLIAAGSTETEGPSRATLGGAPLQVPPEAWVTFPQILSVREAIPTRDGWLLLDQRASQIHILSAAGILTATFGRPGDGPGELEYPAGMALVADTVWVVNLTGTRVDGFTRDGAFLRRIRPEPPCSTPYLDDVAPVGAELVLALRCLGFGGTSRHLLHVDLASGLVRPLAWPAEDDPTGWGDWTRLVGTPSGLFAGSMFQRCLRSTDDQGPAPQCLDAEDRVRLPSAIRDSLQARTERRPLRGFGRSVPPHYPYIMDAFQTSQGLVVVQPEGEDTAVLRLLSGPRPWVLRAPDRSVPFVGRNEILLVEGVLEGVRIALAQLPGEMP